MTPENHECAPHTKSLGEPLQRSRREYADAENEFNTGAPRAQ